jgi:hypothetical protein
LIYLVVTVGEYNYLLERFIKYYKRLGIQEFLVIINGNYKRPIKVLKNFGLKPICIWKEEFSEKLKVFYERDVIDKICEKNSWIVYTDLDEFQYYKKGFINTIKECEKENKKYLYGRLIDRVSSTGRLIKIRDDLSLEEQFPLCGFLTEKILKAWDRKIVLAKKNLVVGGGHHVFLDKKNLKPCKYIKSNDYIEIHHFKWDSSLLQRIRKYQKYSHHSLKAWKKEMIRFLQYFNQNNRILLEDLYRNNIRLGI